MTQESVGETPNLPSGDPEELPLAFRQQSPLEGFLPIVGWVLGEQLGGRLFGDEAADQTAIIAMTAASGWAVVQRRRRGQNIGWWIPALATYFLLRGIAGIIWGETVFLSVGIGLKVALGLTALGSVLIGRAAATYLAPMLLPFNAHVRAHRRFFVTMRNLTLAYAVYQLITVIFEIWLLNETSSGTGFLLIRLAVGWVMGGLGFLAAILYADRSLKTIPGFPGVIKQFEEIGLIIEQKRGGRA